ncbi:hypothetical protein F7P10_04245 [Actinomadura sp. WMMB 499]|nr:hypothetical protein F7P10_04245 [Actinomadura sp. WMMB 499]
MLCLTCHRVRPALDRADYTADRALLILRRGLCTCVAPLPPARGRPARPSTPDVPAAPRGARRPAAGAPRTAAGRFGPPAPLHRNDT